MPSYVTHNKSYFEIYKTLPTEIQKRYEEHWSKYNIFAMGHDTAYAYAAMTVLMHFHKLPTLLKELKIIQDKDIQDLTINYINAMQNPKAETKLFLYGYLMHHFLDAKLHPLIVYETGDFLNSLTCEADHLLLERMIDSYLLKQVGINPQKFKVHRLVTSKMALTEETRSVINKSFNLTYQINDFDRVFAEYNKHTRAFLRATHYDPYGIKKILFKPLDIALKGRFKPSYWTHTHDGTEAIPYLNLANEKWEHPVEGNGFSYASFEDLYSDGIKEISQMIKNLDMAIIDQATENELRDIIPNISSSYGLPPSDNIKITNNRKK